MIKKISLAQKGMLFFLVPAVAQVVLLLGVVIIQVETANYYPHRAAQDREITDAHTDSLLADFLLLKDIRKLLDARAAPSATDREDLRALDVYLKNPVKTISWHFAPHLMPHLLLSTLPNIRVMTTSS